MKRSYNPLPSRPCEKCGRSLSECLCIRRIEVRGKNEIAGKALSELLKMNRYSKVQVKNLMLEFGIEIIRQVKLKTIGDFDQDEWIENRLKN